MIRLMSDCLLRISEVVAVDVADVGSALRIRQSKTHPGTAGIPDVTLYIGEPTREAIKRYCEAGNITEGPLFRWVRRGDHIANTRLTIDGVRKIIKRRARAAGIEGKISGHSLRIGSAISLAQAGASVVNMQVAGTVEIASNAGALRTRRINRTRRDRAVQIRKVKRGS